MPSTQQNVLLSSGGMDSFLLACEPKLRRGLHVFVDIGQKYLQKERKAAAFIAKEVGATFVEMKTAQLAEYEHSSGIIPFRNAEMILCAAQHGTQIYLGVIADEINSDKSLEFCEAMENVLNISHRKQYWTEGKQYAICTPFRQFSKTQLVQKYLSAGYPLSFLLKSVSCYDGGNLHCGSCASCFKRWVALVNATRVDHAVDWGFVQHPYEWKSQSHWANVISGYSETRATEIVNAFAIARGKF